LKKQIKEEPCHENHPYHPLVLGTPWRNLLFVKIEPDEGMVGVGKTRPNSGAFQRVE
jgi:L-alanine-DL-glutamate epimerase-like enolase superfamily enzyme